MEQRKLDVLRAIVTDYVSSHEPVGSKALVDRHDLGVSSATVRNDMAVLEEEGYIAQPHTSAGRIPTDKGYRLFVDQISTLKPLTAAEARAIAAFMAGALDVDDIVARTVRLLAQVTHQVAIVQYPIVSTATVRHIELVPVAEERVQAIMINSSGRVEQRTLELAASESELALLRDAVNLHLVGVSLAEAATRLDDLSRVLPPRLRKPGDELARALGDMLDSGVTTRVAVGGVGNLTSFGNAGFDAIRPVLEALEEQVVLLQLLSEVRDDADVVVRIGAENPHQQLATASVVASSYGNRPSVRASLGVLGPTRMDYPSTMASVRAVARYVGRFLSEN